MDIYLVGGAVRDVLLGRTAKDRDYVVVGATAEDLTRLKAEGYRPVGKDFPVFLHPETHEEYALARVERKVGAGHCGFVCQTSERVTLEEDLSRRDLTINAIAQAADGRIIDPFQGAKDLAAGILRHVSPAFSEDPLRVLRVARFAARYNFTVAEETLALMQAMVAADTLETLSVERIWAETVKALQGPYPSQYITILRDCGALARAFPEIDRLFGVPQPAIHHPEIDTGVHTLLTLTRAAALSEDPVVRFSALVHDVGKGVTPAEEWPQHVDHEEAGVTIIEAMAQRLRIPKSYRDMARLVSRHHLRCHRALELRAGSILKVLEALGALQHPDRLETFLLACTADAQGRLGCEDTPYPQAEVYRKALAAAREVTAQPLVERGHAGPKLGLLMQSARIHAIKHVL